MQDSTRLKPQEITLRSFKNFLMTQQTTKITEESVYYLGKVQSSLHYLWSFHLCTKGKYVESIYEKICPTKFHTKANM
jgi:hypothetical protein